MTSQIVLGNGHGIAVASDSAMTMGGRRTYDTSEKIYPLPLPHAVAVLHAGNVVFHRMPYSTIISSWIQSIGDHQLRNLPDYVESFRKFLVDEINGWCDLEQQKSDFIGNMHYEFKRIWNLMFVGGAVVSPSEALKIWQSEVKNVSAMDSYTHSRASVQEKFNQIWSKQTDGSDGVNERVEYWFDDVPRTTEIDELIEQYVWKSIANHYPLSDEYSALLTFVGFGTKSMIPALQRLEMHGALDDTIVWDQDDMRYATKHPNGFLLIDVIGQQRAISTFLRGYDPELPQTIQTASSGAFEKKIESESAGQQRSEESPSQPDLTVENKMGEIIESAFADFGEETRLGSFRTTAAGMPLASLAATAKSLIQIQELSLDSRGELPIVGGQVRVGTITKTNGFKWV